MNGGVTAVLVGLGIAGGFIVGRTSGSSGQTGAGQTGAGGAGTKAGAGSPEAGAKSDRSGGQGGARSGSREGSSGRSAAASIRQVARELELSPMSTMDFDAMFEAYDAIRWMTPKDIQVALAELESAVTNPQTKMMMKMMLINQWAKKDGQGAVEFAMQDGEAMTKTMGIMGGMMGWLKQDPEAAYAWYKENQSKLSEGGMMAGQLDGMILAALAQRDLPRAFEGLRGLGPQAQEIALAVMGSQMTMDPVRREQFVKYLEGVDDDALRQKGLEGMMQSWAVQDPKGAAEFVASREWEGDTGRRLRERLAASWGMMDAEAAMTWRLETLGPGEDRAEVVASGFSQWMTQNPEEAQQWLQTQPEEVRGDSLYQQTANQLHWRSNFTEAVEWAGKIEAQAVREETLRGVYQNWKNQKPEAAQEWIEQLDPSLRESLETGGPTAVDLQATDALVVPAAPTPR